MCATIQSPCIYGFLSLSYLKIYTYKIDTWALTLSKKRLRVFRNRKTKKMHNELHNLHSSPNTMTKSGSRFLQTLVSIHQTTLYHTLEDGDFGFIWLRIGP
jgi:hypothetical protein